MTTNSTIHSLSAEQRDTMRELIAAGLVVTVGDHSRQTAELRAINAELVACHETLLTRATLAAERAENAENGLRRIIWDGNLTVSSAREIARAALDKVRPA